MRTRLLIILFVALFGCSKEPKILIDPELRPYYDSFIYEAEIRGFDFSGHDIEIKFGEIKGGLAKVLKGPVIIVDEEDFYQRTGNMIYVDLYQQEMTLYHEFGHAFLNREHTETMTECDRIMSMHLNCKYESYHTQRAEMLDELFE